jgi:hypothetical protein
MHQRFFSVLFFGFLVLWFLGSFVSFSYAGALVYSTYLGGSRIGWDFGDGIALDPAGNAYITGVTYSSTPSNDFPTTAGAFDTTYNGGNADVFVSKLNVTGSALVYSTYLGGSGYDDGYEIAVDPVGNAYITGMTSSSDFPTTPGAFDTSFNGWYDVFVTKLNASGTALVYSTYLGGSNKDYGEGIALDSAGNAYITGWTFSSNFSTTVGAYDTAYHSCFVSKLNPSGTGLIYSTYLGGSGGEEGRGIAVDASGNAYIIGVTGSGFPTTAGVWDTSYNGFQDGFVSKLNPSGTGLVYSTYFGGSDDDYSSDIAVDAFGNTYLTGRTSSSDFPTTAGAFDTTDNGVWDVFVSKLNSTGSALAYSTYLGGSGDFDYGWDIAVDPVGNAYVTGYTNSSNFPTTPGAFDTTFNGGGFDLSDVFVSKLNATGSALAYSTYLGGSGDDGGFNIALDNAGNAYITGWTDSSDFPTTAGAFDTSLNGGDDVFVTKLSLVPTITTTYFNTSGSFDFSTDTSNWLLEKYGNGISPGYLSWIGAYQCIAITQTPGQKGKLTQVFSVPSSGWYTATARVLTDISNVNKQQKVYLYLQQLNSALDIVATGNQVIQPGSGGLNVGGWKPLEISFYATGTILAVQVVAINNTNSGATGNLYIDDIWVYAGGPQVSTPIPITNPSFESGTTGWLIQPYGDAVSAGVWTEWSGFLIGGQGSGEKGKASQLYSASTSETHGSLWVFSAATSMSQTQKVYLYIYSYDNAYNKIIESGNAILQPGRWTPAEWHQLQFGYTPFTQYNAIQLVAINPIGNPNQAIYFDDVAITQEP